MLTSMNLIERIDPNGAARNNAFQLTPSGAALRPTLEALGNWSQKYLKSFHPEIVSLD